MPTQNNAPEPQSPTSSRLVLASSQATRNRSNPGGPPQRSRSTITVAVHEAATDRQIAFYENFEVESPFHDAISCLERYLDTVYKSKARGTTEYFAAFVLTDRDNPFRVQFEVQYGPKKWRKIYNGAPLFNESGTSPYQIRWMVPEHIDTFPSNDLATNGKRVIWDTFTQAQRFGTYEAIIGTFKSRVRGRLHRRLGNEEYVDSFSFFDSDEPEWEPIDLVERLAQGEDDKTVAKWLIERDSGCSSEVKELVRLLRDNCSSEISILRTIHEMAGKQADCSAIVAKAKEMLHEYDKTTAVQKLGADKPLKA